MPYFNTSDDCKLYYKTYDFDTSKPTVVFLNGTTQTAVYWEAQRKVFIDRFRLLMYDARAQGKSDLCKKELSLQSHVTDLRELFDHLAVEKSHLVGLSHGAQVALAFCVQIPERVNRLVLCSLGARPSDHSKAIVQSWIETLKKSGVEAMVREALPMVFGEKYLAENKRILSMIVNAIVARNRPDALITHLEALTRYPPPLQLPKEITSPTLVISGADDPLVSKESAGEIAEAVNGHHREVLDVGHTVPTEAPQIFNDIVLDFLLN
jgi:pimeloyl-ACP methyl ester carboxylesterase